MSMHTPNPTTRAMSNVTLTSSPVLHPDYTYWSPYWEMIRDAEIGEVEVKRKGRKYLPKMSGHDEHQYAAYLRRAVFFNMTAKTLNSLYGTVFRRNPKVFGFDKKLLKQANRLSKDGMSLNLTAKVAVKEVLAVGRYGMMIDSDPSGRGDAYAACYTAENILDWQLEEIDGEWKFTRVVLRELEYARSDKFSPYDYKSLFRVLVLSPTEEGWVYEQHIYRDAEGNGIPDVDAAPDDIIIPTVRGELIDTIPFVVIGPFTNHPNVQKPPLLDIVTLNFSHYESYANLEAGRFYTATPVYWTNTSKQGENDTAQDYYVGPDVVWELGKDGSAGLIEFNGHGLRSLEMALKDKEAQISSIGGRMMPGSSRGAAESDNSLKMKEQNEQTLLLNIADTVDEAFTQILKWWADWNNVSPAKQERITFEVNRDFLLKDIGAREFRAIHQMYADGVIPVDVVYDYLRKAEVIPDWMDGDEFKELLDDAQQFPHMVDVLARMNDMPDAKADLGYKMHKEQLDSDMEIAKTAAEAKPNPDDPKEPPVPKQAQQANELRKRGQ